MTKIEEIKSYLSDPIIRPNAIRDHGWLEWCVKRIEDLETELDFLKKNFNDEYELRSEWQHRARVMRGLIEGMQADVQKYLPPDRIECTQEWLVNRISRKDDLRDDVDRRAVEVDVVGAGGEEQR